jgi:hypothetical protein
MELFGFGGGDKRRAQSEKSGPPRLSNAQIIGEIQNLDSWIRSGAGTRDDGKKRDELMAMLTERGGVFDAGVARNYAHRPLSEMPLTRRIQERQALNTALPPTDRVISSTQPKNN